MEKHLAITGSRGKLWRHGGLQKMAKRHMKRCSTLLIIQFSSVTQSCLTLRPHESQHARPPCPSPTPGVYPNPCPLSRECHPAISSSVIPCSSHPQSFPSLGSFPMNQLFAWDGQSIGVSASTSVLPMNTQDWSPLGWTGWISLQSQGLSRVFSNTTVQKHQFFGAQLSLSRMSDSRWVNTPSWLSGSWRSFLYSSSVYSCHLFLISSASVRYTQFLSFIVLIFAWNVPLVPIIFLKIISSLSHSVVVLYFFALIAEEGFLISPCYSLKLCIQMGISFLFSFAFRFSSFHSYL